jgi:hypothetical protein
MRKAGKLERHERLDWRADDGFAGLIEHRAADRAERYQYDLGGSEPLASLNRELFRARAAVPGVGVPRTRRCQSVRPRRDVQQHEPATLVGELARRAAANRAASDSTHPGPHELGRS